MHFGGESVVVGSSAMGLKTLVVLFSTSSTTDENWTAGGGGSITSAHPNKVPSQTMANALLLYFLQKR